MKNQKQTHWVEKKPKVGHRFRWHRKYTPADQDRSFNRVVYELIHDLPDGRVYVSNVVFGDHEPRKVLARRLRYTKMVLLRRVRENG